jgi:DNA-binding response OmpR family regulator
LRGYSTGAVDYLFKPFDPWALRTKVGIFTQLYNKTKRLEEQDLIAKRIQETVAELKATIDGGQDADATGSLTARLEALAKQFPQ